MSHESGASEAQAPMNLVDLFQEGDTCIERRRTDNLFRQLDERQLTEDEQSIIQQRVDLQRKMFQEYERREKQRKVRELQEVCPDLDEEAATRALELCHWKEEDAAVRISSDPAFLRRACTGAVEEAPAPEQARRPRTTTRAPVGPRPKKVDPNQVGAVFIGRFKARLGPHQLSAMERQQRTATATVAAGGAGGSGQGRRGGRAAKADADAAAAKAAAAAEEEAQQHEEAQAAAAAAAEQQLVAEGADVDMADAEGEQAPEGAEGDCESEDGDDADAEEAEPNSADLSDNEPQYEDDVMLPVLSPPPAARQGRQQQDGQQEGEPEGERVPGPSPRFQYRLVAETPNGGVQSVATTEWNALRNAGSGADQGGAAGQEAAAGAAAGIDRAAAPTPVGGGGCAPNAATGLAMAGAGAAEGEEVSSPRQHLQLSGPFTVTRSGAKQAASLQQTGAAAVAAAAAAKALAACATSAPAAAKPEAVAAAPQQEEATREPPQAVPAPASAPAPAAAPTGRGGRARRAAAETALFLASARRAARSGSADSGFGEDPIASGSASDAETATDGSDFEAEIEAEARGVAAASACAAAVGGRAGRAGVAAAVLAAAAAGSSSESDDDFVDDEASDDDFLEGGGRKRRGGGGRQPARKRGRAAAPVTAHAAPPAAPVETAVPVAAEAGTSGRDAAGAEAAHDSEATETEDEGAANGRGRAAAKGKKAGGRGGRAAAASKAGAAGAAGGGAISASGHTCRGRVKQKGVKRAELLAVGKLVPRQGWFNAGYIFPAGFKASTSFRSSVDLDALTVHTCEILGEGGQYWPQPTYVVTAADRPDEPLVAKSCTGCWTAVLKRINAEIEGRRAAGEQLPPPPKTAIAGPEYFGLNQPDICASIEALDPERLCAVYWDGKMDREAARGGQPGLARARATGTAAAGGEGAAAPAKAPRAPRNSTGGGGGRGKRAGRRGSGAVEEEDEQEGANGDEDPEETYAGNRWSAVSRAERYRKRREDAGEDAAALLAEVNATNPLPGFLDPITLEPVVNPAISPFGHVMGLATWRAVLAEQGRCPFTKKSLKAEALTVLTKNNIERYRSRIVNAI